MTFPLPEPQPATDGQRELTAQERANEIIAEVNSVYSQPPRRKPAEIKGYPPSRPASPPVDLHGTPPMTARETQIGKVALYVGAGVSMPILASAVFMVATERANPDVIAWCAGGVGALAALVAALGYLVKRIVTAAPPPPAEVHNHYTGAIEHKEINVENVNKWGSKSSTNAIN